LVDPILRQTEEPPLLHKFNRFWDIPRSLVGKCCGRARRALWFSKAIPVPC